MSAKRRSKRRPYTEGHIPLDLDRMASIPHAEAGFGAETYTVRLVNSGMKTYICPGCQNEIKIGTPHTVVWPQQSPFGSGNGLSERRHWHSNCWRRRLRPN